MLRNKKYLFFMIVAMFSSGVVLNLDNRMLELMFLMVCLFSFSLAMFEVDDFEKHKNEIINQAYRILDGLE